jgi:hypothetical protein
MSRSETTILQLPDELLVNVTDSVGITDLHALSLTCRLMRPSAQEGLIKRATLVLENAWKLMAMLQNHPDLIASFTHLRLGPITESASRDILESHSAARESSKKHEEHSISDADASSLCVFERMTALLTIAHSLKAVSMSAMSVVGFQSLEASRTLFDCHNNPTTRPVNRSVEQARSNLHARLEEINIKADPCTVIPPTSLIMSLTFSNLSSLKRLVIPYEGLFQRQWIHDGGAVRCTIYDLGKTEPHQILPPSLESLHASFDTYGTLYLDVQWFDKLMSDDVNFLRLRKVQLQYPYNLISIAWHMCSRPSLAKKLLAALRKWQASRVNLTTTFGIEKLIVQNPRKATEHFTPGDLITTIEKCLATTHDQLENEPEMMAALGFVKRSS